MPSTVYFTDFRAKQGLNLLDKVGKLFDAAGFGDLIAPNNLVAVKVHFGERGNTTYIRPQYIRRIVDKIKERGGKPFLTDTNTLYRGSRGNAVDHLVTALENGFGYEVTGAPIVIADGLNGKDYLHVDIGLKHFDTVKISSAVHYADVLITISHFKGHEATGFGGTLKNVGMGIGSRSGKQMMHSDILPSVNVDKCVGCERCREWCPAEAIVINEQKSTIAHERCIGCGECTVTCPVQAIAINWKTEPDMIQEKIVEYTYGVLKNKKGKAGFLTFINNVTPDCDCCGWSDAPIVADVGIIASNDPIALDQAAVDLVNRQSGLAGTRLGENTEENDKFRAIFPGIDWHVQLKYGEEQGLGQRNYKLIKI